MISQKVISLFLCLSLLSQPLILPLRVLAQTPTLPPSSATGYPSLSPTPLPPPPSSHITQYTYDAAGNLLSDQEKEITWDAEGRVVKIVKGDLEVRFLYDGKGERIAKMVKDNKTGELSSFILYLGSIEKDLLNNQETIYYPASSSLAQRKVDSQKDNLIFIHKDHLSSSVFLTDKDGNSLKDETGRSIALLTYYPYGRLRPTQDSQPTNPPLNKRFTGQTYDEETNLYYYHARYYNPKLGMFISPDTLNDSLNLIL